MQNVVRAFWENIVGLSQRDRGVLIALALTGGSNAQALGKLLNKAGERVDGRRLWKTRPVRVVLDELVRRNLAWKNGTRSYATSFGVRHLVLRLAGTDELLASVTTLLRYALYSPRARDPVGRALDARIAIARRAANAPQLFEALKKESSSWATSVAIEFVTRPFDAAWLDTVDANLQNSMINQALPTLEVQGYNVADLIQYISDKGVSLYSGPARALGNLRLLQGNTSSARHFATAWNDDSHRTAGMNGAAYVIEGDFARALETFSDEGRRQSLHAGIAGVLHVLLLLAKPRDVHDLETARRLVNIGSRKDNAFSSSYRLLRELVEDADPEVVFSEASVSTLEKDRDDCLTTLIGLLCVAWKAKGNFGEMPGGALENLDVTRSRELPWLGAQYRATLGTLTRRMSGATQAIARLGDREPIGAPLVSARIFEDAWESTLEQIEQIAARHASDGNDGVHDERVIFRVTPARLLIEPHLQKKVGKGWSSGQRIAVGELLSDGAHSLAVTKDDARVVHFLGTDRDTGLSAAARATFQREAWLALIGHPRVFLVDAPSPIEVTRGEVQLHATARGDDVVLALHPANLSETVHVRSEGDRLVVFVLGEEQRALLKLLKRELAIPAEAKARALEAITRLANVVSIQSSEQTGLASVEADARPWLRLVPRGHGLAVTLDVRPLGARGPIVAPGRGSNVVLGHAALGLAQTHRDFALETAARDEAVAACELEGHETGDNAWAITDLDACLALVSSLHEQGERVHVEWPEGRALKLRKRAGAKALRGTLRRERGLFFAAGALHVDADLAVELDDLLRLIGDGKRRFMKLDSGEYLELEQELRDLLGAMAAARVTSEKGSAVALPSSAIAVVQRLAEEETVRLDDASRAYRDRYLKALETTHAVPAAIQVSLRGYQEQGFQWLARLAEVELGACLADDMGLGKTLQLITLLTHRAAHGPAIVVAPTSVCGNWANEIARFSTALRVRAYWSADRARALEDLAPGDVLITSYALLQQDIARLEPIAFATAVLDEAQLIKNADTMRAKAAHALRASVKIAATGTPIENHVGDLFGLFRFLMPELFGSWTEFATRFGGASANETQTARRRALRQLIQPFVLRRLKSQVLDDLPPITEIQHAVTLSEGEVALYETVRRRAVETLAAVGNAQSPIQVLAEITRLRRLCCHPALVVPETKVGSSKLAAFLELTRELLSNGHRILVFSQFVDVLGLARQMLEKESIALQYLDGSTPQKQRDAAVEAFQNGEGEVFLISLKAGGFGLNLTSADYVIHLDPWWNPAVEAQASNRAHRIGQSRPVTVYRLVAEGTIEARIVELHASKRELADELLEGTERSASLGADELRALLA
jgi:superfamily II DNA or RNA helicase